MCVFVVIIVIVGEDVGIVYDVGNDFDRYCW